ncbi:glycosyltransferase family A protein [Paenibacillus sp. FJAT-27812]|uniref:glycosyltransferase family A protein n=1 Tax=Paenibacillus sp. FJAT-27812 TaxID=1684143 RepID=UPI0006A7C95F|nr:glycosyltransferase family A protein [Paenibacillus sp. FJAT-27812]
MKLQVLLSTMHQKDHSIIDKMNIKTDAIIINQCDRNEIEQFNHKGNTINYFSLAERGVGLSRNNALMRATADICLFADDDVTYVEGYNETIIRAFEQIPNADVLLFNIPSTNSERPTCNILVQHKVNVFNSLKYGAINIAVKTKKVHMANIMFSLKFGGGAQYSAGEDSLFLTDCIKKKLNVYAVPETIGYVEQETSTWFNGFTDKYFFDKGIFFACLSKRWAYLLCLQFAFRKSRLYKNEMSITRACTLMFQGVKAA